MKTIPLLDEVVLLDGTKITGVIDYCSTKQIYMYKFEKQTEVDFTLLACLWKGNDYMKRFSVYVLLNYPNVTLPPAVVIPKVNIKECNRDLTNTKEKKPTKKMIYG